MKHILYIPYDNLITNVNYLAFSVCDEPLTNAKCPTVMSSATVMI